MWCILIINTATATKAKDAGQVAAKSPQELFGWDYQMVLSQQEFIY